MSQRLDMLEKLIAKGTDDPFVFYARAMELKNLERGDDALRAFADLRVRFPAYVPTYLMAGQLALERGEATLAREFLEEGVIRARAAGDEHAVSELTRVRASLDA